MFITDVFVTEVHRRSIHSQTSKSSNIHRLVWQTTVTPHGTRLSHNKGTDFSCSHVWLIPRSRVLSGRSQGIKGCTLYHFIYVQVQSERRPRVTGGEMDIYQAGAEGRSVARRKVLCDDCRDSYAKCTHLPKLIKLYTYRW